MSSCFGGKQPLFQPDGPFIRRQKTSCLASSRCRHMPTRSVIRSDTFNLSRLKPTKLLLIPRLPTPLRSLWRKKNVSSCFPRCGQHRRELHLSSSAHFVWKTRVKNRKVFEETRAIDTIRHIVSMTGVVQCNKNEAALLISRCSLFEDYSIQLFPQIVTRRRGAQNTPRTSVIYLTFFFLSRVYYMHR